MSEAPRPNLIASAGKIQVLDLGVLKERLGPKWDRMALHVQMFFEAAIRRALKPGDTFSRIEDLSYVVMFRDLTATEAEIECAAISEEVCKRLFGENGEQVSLRNLVARVNLSTIPTGDEQKSKLSALLEREGKEVIVTRSGASAQAQGTSAKTFRLIMNGNALTRERISTDDLRFVYRPIWDAVNHVVLTYLCQPTLPFLLAGAASGFCTTDQEDDQALLDLHILQECIDRGTRLRTQGLRVILAAPVHFSTISRQRSWQDYSNVLRRVPREIARDLAYVMFGIDHGVPHIRLSQELPKLSRTAYRVFCAVDRYQGIGARFAKTSAHGVGTTLDEREDEASSVSRIRDVAKETQAAAIESFVLGLRSTSLALQSIHSGIRYLEGSAVRSAVSDPRHGFAHDIEDLYKAKRVSA